MKDNALIVFTRLPIPGQTKTRLMPHLSGEECSSLHRELLTALAPLLAALDMDIFVFHTPAGPAEEVKALKKLLGPACYLPQQGNSLGMRMHQAIAEVLSKGYATCLLMGTDIPNVTVADIESAAALLSAYDVVFCPTEDGGYWLLGLKHPHQPLFTAQPYGKATVLESAMAVCSCHQLSVSLGAKKRDIDTVEDLAYYRRLAGTGV